MADSDVDNLSGAMQAREIEGALLDSVVLEPASAPLRVCLATPLPSHGHELQRRPLLCALPSRKLSSAGRLTRKIGGAPALRPDMHAVGATEAGRAHLLTQWTRPTLGWLRLQPWRWIG